MRSPLPPLQVRRSLLSLVLMPILVCSPRMLALAGAQSTNQGSQDVNRLLAAAAKALKEREFDLARQLLDQALQHKPGSVQALFMMADLNVQSGREDEAIGYFQRALQLQPGSFAGHYELALAYLRQNKIRDGLRELRIAVQINPRQPDAVYNLALVLLETGNPREAIDRLRQATVIGSGTSGP